MRRAAEYWAHVRRAGIPRAPDPTLEADCIVAAQAYLVTGLGDGIDASGAGAPSELMRQLAADMRNAGEPRLRGSMRSMLNLRIGARVKSLPMPVLMAAGDADELIPLGAMLATWAKYPAGTGLAVWHGVGHSPNLDCPGEVGAVLRHFIEVTIPARAKAVAA